MTQNFKFKLSICATAFLVASVGIGGAADVPLRDSPAAIKKARFVCKLEPHGLPGDWQATFKKNPAFGDEWHVWFGEKPEPLCGFVGAIVKADGSYTLHHYCLQTDRAETENCPLM